MLLIKFSLWHYFFLIFGFSQIGESAFSKGDWVVVTVNQKETMRLPLDKDQTTHAKGPLGLTEIEIKKGRARIVRSPCKNKVCIKSGYIRYADRLAACIPNRVVVRIVGKNHRGVDAVVG